MPLPAQCSSAASYSVLPWIDASRYDSNYAPTSFGDILLSDRSMLTKVNKTADVIAFYNLALHSSNSSIIAFTPSEPPQFSYSSAILEEILKDGGRTLVFTAQACSGAPQAVSMAINNNNNNATAATTPVGADTTSSIAISGGTWNMRSLQTRYPQEIRPIQTGLGTSYLVDTIIIIEEASQQQ